jgi:hypothetical protein
MPPRQRRQHMQKASINLTEKKVTLDEAQALIAQAQKNRLEACQKELTALLAKYGAQLVAQASITPDGRILASMVLLDAPNAS